MTSRAFVIAAPVVLVAFGLVLAACPGPMCDFPVTCFDNCTSRNVVASACAPCPSGSVTAASCSASDAGVDGGTQGSVTLLDGGVCSGEPDGGSFHTGAGQSGNATVETDQFCGACAAELRDGGASGTACSEAGGCATYCCSCPSGAKQYRARACMNSGTCGSEAQACAEAEALFHWCQ